MCGNVRRDVDHFQKEPDYVSQFSPLWANQLFLPARTDPTFKSWTAKGLVTIQELHLSESDVLLTFQELQIKYKLDKKHYFKYFQLGYFIRANQKPNFG